MKKNSFYIIGSILLFIYLSSSIFSGCSLNNLNATDKISSPSNSLSPLNGVWEVKRYKVFNSGSKTYQESKRKPANLLGSKAAFNKEHSFLIDEICKDPQYKLKEVNANNYFFYTYKVDKEDLDIKEDKIEVISVVRDGGLFYDFIKINEKELVVYLDDVFYYLEKIDDDTSKVLSKENLEKLQKNKIENPLEKDELLRTGVLIGLRSNTPIEYEDILGAEYENKSIFYRTIWIGSENSRLHPILETPNLFVPRVSGFWWLGVDVSGLNSEYPTNTLFSYPVGKERKDFSDIKLMDEQSLKRILFVGNDYVAIEQKNASNFNDDEGRSILQVRLIDNILDNKGIKISDISGEEGKTSVYDSAVAFLALEDKESSKRLEQEPREESFALYRRNGHWIVKGRLNSVNTNDSFYKDYNINIVPPKKMLNYDEFHISWNDVKEKVPGAVDAYTSPNKDLAIIISDNNLYVYKILNGTLENMYLKKIALKQGESVVMAEWATGEYMERWEKTLKGNADIFVR
ncbi:hypothetical protein [uncultured Clostridium sp.]|uniref:hypothetical protein n=1 Tax=uncultured Clostridium sp. TaxID=59620 RepID=UPI0028E76903|nr:hypothetical protein [uncultured Clostridium sp.]